MSFTHNRLDKHTEVYSNSQLNSFRCLLDDSIDIFLLQNSIYDKCSYFFIEVEVCRIMQRCILKNWKN